MLFFKKYKKPDDIEKLRTSIDNLRQKIQSLDKIVDDYINNLQIQNVDNINITIKE